MHNITHLFTVTELTSWHIKPLSFFLARTMTMMSECFVFSPASQTPDPSRVAGHATNTSVMFVLFLTTEIELIVSSHDQTGESTFLGRAGQHHIAEQLALGGAEGRRCCWWTRHYIVHTDTEVFHNLDLVVGIPDVTWRKMQQVTVLHSDQMSLTEV